MNDQVPNATSNVAASASPCTLEYLTTPKENTPHNFGPVRLSFLSMHSVHHGAHYFLSPYMIIASLITGILKRSSFVHSGTTRWRV